MSDMIFRKKPRRWEKVCWVLSGLLFMACSPQGAGHQEPPTAEAVPPFVAPTGPEVVVVGTVQDGGLPHAGCTCDRCEKARHHPEAHRRVASLAIVLPDSGKTYLVDATPDIGAQLHALRSFRPQAPVGRADRAPIDGVFLTHAHMGHYLGLSHLGFEVLHTSKVPVYSTPKMAQFLRENGPWGQLVEKENIELFETLPEVWVDLGEGVSVRGFTVPHRDEYSDTVAYEIRGPERTVVYVPDTDGWSAWPTPLREVLASVDVALLDGTFYSLAELPGRDLATVRHPLITHSMDLLQEDVSSGRLEVVFTHLNHSNPALEQDSPAAREIEKRGFSVASEGQRLSI